MRRRSSTPSVTLFPFLAVLVCTMGALIFLLLVTTRRIQKQGALPLVEIEFPLEQAIENTFSIEIPTSSRIVPVHPIDLSISSARSTTIEIDENEPILPLMAGNSLSENEELRSFWATQAQQRNEKYLAARAKQHHLQSQLDQEWNQKKVTLEQELKGQESKLRQLIESLAERQLELDLLKTQQRSNSLLAESVLDKLAAAQKLMSAEQQGRLRLQNVAAELTRQIARLEETRAQAIPQTEIVAYDSLTGTSRKPILIECRQSEIIFASEGVVISAKELSGFPSEYNPLKAGAEALLEYWSQHENKQEKPYILLVVRPQGTTGFYIARGLLSKMDHHFGYELVDQDLALRWPESDPQAVQACQEAVFKVLSERERVLARTGRLAATQGPLNYSNNRGEFRIPEWNSLDRSRAGNFIGDEKWISPKGRNLSQDMSSNRSPELLSRPIAPRSAFPTETPIPLLDESELGEVRDHQTPTNLETNSPPQPSGQLLNPGESSSPRPQIIEFPHAQQNPPNGHTTASDSPQMLPSMRARQLRPNDAFSQFPQNPFENKPENSAQPGPDRSAEGAPGLTIPRRAGIIGIERETEIHLWQNQFRIDDAVALIIPEGTASQDVKNALSAAIAHATSQWKDPPQAYFWKPVVKIVIYPGGLVHYPQAKALVDQWEVASKIEYEIQ